MPLLGVAIAASAGFPQVVRGRAIPIACMLLVASVWSISVNLYVGRAREEAMSFVPAARQLAAQATPGDKVLLEPIGLIGWTAPVVVIDEVGLVSPEVAKRRVQGAGWYTDVVARERPTWLVVRAGVLRTGAAFAGTGAPFRDSGERDALLAAYQRVSPEVANEGDQSLVVLKRR